MKFTVGIDLGGTRCKIGILKGSKLLCSSHYPSFKDQKTDHNMDIVEGHLIDFCKQNNVPLDEISEIGIAFPGIVNPISGKVVSSRGKYTDAHEFDFKNWAKKNYSSNLHIDNDSRLACWGEHTTGAAMGYTDVVMVTFGTGIGTGVVLDGELLLGNHFQGGCLGGHITIIANGHECFCGNQGCLEKETSIAILSAYAHSLPNYRSSSLADCPPLTFAMLFDHMREGDFIATEVAKYCMSLWGAGLVSFIHAYDPQVIILGGGVLNSADIIIPFLKEFVEQNAWTPSGQVEIKLSLLGDNGGVIGAARMAQKTYV